MKRIENQIIEYISGEMNDADRIAFEQLMQSEPDIRQQVEELQSTQSVMSHWSDESIEIPHFDLPEAQPVVTETKVVQMQSRAPWIKYAASAAAVVAMLWLSGLQINTAGNSLTLSFGSPDMHIDIDNKIDDAVNNALEKYSKNQQTQLAQFSNQIGNEINALKTSVNPEPLDWNKEKASLKTMMNQLSKEQYAQLETVLDNYQAEQKNRMNDSFADLMEYIDDKRIDDLSQIQGAFTQLVAAMDAQQERTDELFQGLVQPMAANVDY